MRNRPHKASPAIGKTSYHNRSPVQVPSHHSPYSRIGGTVKPVTDIPINRQSGVPQQSAIHPALENVYGYDNLFGAPAGYDFLMTPLDRPKNVK